MLWAIACVSCNAGKLPDLRFKPLEFFICAWETYLLMLSTTMKSWLRHRVLVCRAYMGIFIWWSIYFGAFAQQWLNPLIKVIDSKTAKSGSFSKFSGFSVSYRVNSKNGWWNASKSMCFQTKTHPCMHSLKLCWFHSCGQRFLNTSTLTAGVWCS